MPRSLAIAVVVATACATRPPAAKPPDVGMCRCTPGQPCWPSAAEWQQFGATLHGRLEQPQLPDRTAKNPFALQDKSGGTESTGWLDAWKAAPSAWAVVARDA